MALKYKKSAVTVEREKKEAKLQDKLESEKAEQKKPKLLVQKQVKQKKETKIRAEQSKKKKHKLSTREEAQHIQKILNAFNIFTDKKKQYTISSLMEMKKKDLEKYKLIIKICKSIKTTFKSNTDPNRIFKFQPGMLAFDPPIDCFIPIIKLPEINILEELGFYKYTLDELLEIALSHAKSEEEKLELNKMSKSSLRHYLIKNNYILLADKKNDDEIKKKSLSNLIISNNLTNKTYFLSDSKGKELLGDVIVIKKKEGVINTEKEINKLLSKRNQLMNILNEYNSNPNIKNNSSSSNITTIKELVNNKNIIPPIIDSNNIKKKDKNDIIEINQKKEEAEGDKKDTTKKNKKDKKESIQNKKKKEDKKDTTLNKKNKNEKKTKKDKNEKNKKDDVTKEQNKKKKDKKIILKSSSEEDSEEESEGSSLADFIDSKNSEDFSDYDSEVTFDSEDESIYSDEEDSYFEDDDSEEDSDEDNHDHHERKNGIDIKKRKAEDNSLNNENGIKKPKNGYTPLQIDLVS